MTTTVHRQRGQYGRSDIRHRLFWFHLQINLYSSFQWNTLIAITLSVQKINAGRRYGERFDPRDYARKLARHLEPNLGDVVVEAIEGRPDHDVEIFLPARAVACTEALELIGNRVREALQRFHDGATAIVERAQPARLRKPVLRELRIAS